MCAIPMLPSQLHIQLVYKPYLKTWKCLHKNVKKWLVSIQVNLFQKHLFLRQLTYNMTKYCSLNYEFRTWKLQAQNMLCTCNSMNNLLSYCGLVDAKIRASDNYLPVLFWFKLDKHSIFGYKCKRKSSSINQLYTKLELPWCSMYYNTQSFAAISYTHNSIIVGDFQLFWFTYDFD